VILDHAEHADLPRLLEIRHAAFSAHAPLAYSKQEVETLLSDVDVAELRGMISNRQLFVARRAGTIVGLAGWKGANLRHVYVDPAYTRRGIASALLRHTEEDFRERTGAYEIKANVVLYAVPFYRANGYEIVGRATAWDGSAYLEMTMRLVA
jgi:ribosomal protein S18 acetylase RimI-like enzyme